MDINLTNEMRDAVHAEDCEILGHQFDFNTMTSRVMVSDPDHPDRVPPIKLQGPEPDMLPYLSCTRCGLVWLVFDDPANNYTKALKKLKKRLIRNDPFLDLVEKEKTPKVPDAQP